MVDCEPEFCDGLKSKPLAMQESGADRIAAGQGLHPGFIQSGALICFARCDEAPADKCGQVVRNSAAVLHFQGRKRHIVAVVAQGFVQGIEQDPFSVAAGSIVDE